MLVIAFQTNAFCIKSPPETTDKSALLIIHFETNVPINPWSRTTPNVFPISWLINTVNVPSPLSYAPIPSINPEAV